MDKLKIFGEALDYIEKEIADFKIKTNKTNVKAAVTLFVISIDHAQGIRILLNMKAYPSASALLRVIFETYIRGMWIGKCANEFQLDKYINNDKVVSPDGKSLHFGDMVDEVENSYNFPSYLSEVKYHTWKGLNSLTHSGSVQLHKNFDGKTLRHVYEEKHIEEAVDFTTMIMSMSFSALLDIITNKHDDSIIENYIKLIQPIAFNKPLEVTSDPPLR